jgi:hypothetical protein
MKRLRNKERDMRNETKKKEQGEKNGKGSHEQQAYKL